VGQSGHVGFRGFAAAHCGKPMAYRSRLWFLEGNSASPGRLLKSYLALVRGGRTIYEVHTNMGHMEDLLRACFV
jgi:hypothetical protein